MADHHIPELRPADPIDGEAPDQYPLYYRSSILSIGIELDGERKSLAEVLDDIYYKLATHHHDPADIDETREDQFVSQDQIDEWNHGVRFNNPKPIYEEHGGILEGRTFDNVPTSDVLMDVLYPNIPPIVEAKILEPAVGYVEHGTSVTLTKVQVYIHRKTDTIKSIAIMNNGSSVFNRTGSEIEQGGTFEFETYITLFDTSNLKVRVTDAAERVVDVPLENWIFVYPMYHGDIDSDTTPTAEQITKLTKSILPKDNKNIFVHSSNNTRLLYAYPKEYGELTKVRDENRMEQLETFNHYTVSITGTDKKAVEYYAYTNNRATVTNFEMNYIW